MIDPVPPTLGMVSGSLFDGGVRRGHQDVKMKAQDTGGGLSRLELLVNHSVAESKTLDCDVAEAANQSVTGTVAVRISPCPALAEAEWSVDTASEPFREGANTVQVCASDFATLGDPNSSCSPPEQVAVDDSCAESAVAGGDELSAEFGESNAETVAVGYGKGATVGGELDTHAGDPVRGATLCVKVGTLDVNPEPEPVALVRTGASGRFSYPSRLGLIAKCSSGIATTRTRSRAGCATTPTSGRRCPSRRASSRTAGGSGCRARFPGRTKAGGS